MLKFVKGPDFPTGGIIVDDHASIAEAYKTGRGGFRVRARWEQEEGARGTYQIVVTEIPYQVQKSKLIERIAELLEQKKLPLLDDVRDESAEDVRLVLVPKSRTVEPELLMEQLFRSTRSRSAHSAQHERAGRRARCRSVMSLQRGAARVRRPPPGGAGAPHRASAWRRSRRGSRCWKAISPSI